MGRPGVVFPRHEGRHATGAGNASHDPISLKLGFSGEDYGYAIDLGLPSNGVFLNDPAIKAECLWTGERLGRANAFAVRNGLSVRIRDSNGEWRQAYTQLGSSTA